MKVSRLDETHDWTFGQSLSNYAIASEAIAQNVITRLLSWKRDWFLDIEAEIDWETLLSERNTQDKIQNEIARVVRNTDGVARVVSVDASLKRQTRTASYQVSYTDIYNETRNITNENR